MGSKKDDTDAVSFRFRRGSKDMFEELVDDNKEALKDRKRKTLGEDEEGSGKSSRTRSSGLINFIFQLHIWFLFTILRLKQGEGHRLRSSSNI